MIQYYLDLEKQVKIISENSLAYGQIQKIFSTAFYLSFTIRAPGKTWHLYFGRGSGQEGMWLHTAAPPSELRRKDTFLEYFRRHLTSCSFIGVELDKFDRIMNLSYQKFGTKQSFLWFWKGRKLYFLHHYQDAPETPFKILLSWRGKAFIPDFEPDNLFEFFDEIGRKVDMNHDLVTMDMPKMSDLLLEELASASLKEKNSLPNFLQRKKENITGDLIKARQWKDIEKILDQGEDLNEMYEFKVGDQKVKFEGELNAYERRNLLYQKIKKLKRGETILTQRLGEVEEKLVGSHKVETKQSTIAIVRPVWGEEKKALVTTTIQTELSYKVFHLEDCQIAVGLNAQGNDQLRSKWAHKEDHWIHLDGHKSSHAIVKVSGQQAIRSEMLNWGATIVAHFSHFNDEWIPIIYTQVKNLKGVAGSAGMVIYKKEKHLRCAKMNLDSLLKE